MQIFFNFFLIFFFSSNYVIKNYNRINFKKFVSRDKINPINLVGYFNPINIVGFINPTFLIGYFNPINLIELF